MLTDLFAVDSASSPTDGTEWRAGVCVGGGGRLFLLALLNLRASLGITPVDECPEARGLDQLDLSW